MSTETVDKILKTFEELKEANDKLQAEIAQKGTADTVLSEKVDKLSTALANLQSEKDAVDKRLSAAETEINTPTGATGKLHGQILELKTAYAMDPGNKEIQNLLLETEIEAAGPEAKSHVDAFYAWIRDNKDPVALGNLKAAERTARTARAAKGVEIGVGNLGGNAVPEELQRAIQRVVREFGNMRQDARVRSVGSSDYKELVDRSNDTGGWVGEKGTRTETNTPTLEECKPTMGIVYGRPTATEESLGDIFFDVPSWLVQSSGLTIAQYEGVAFISGDGTNKPTGLLDGTPTKDADGARAYGVLEYIATGVAGDFAATNPGDALIDLAYKVKAGHRGKARYRMNKSILGEVMKFKNTTGDYLWQPSIAMGQPSTLGGYPVSEDAAMPDKAADSFSIAFGNFDAAYLITDHVAHGMRVTVDDNITVPGFVKFYVRRRVGGKVFEDEGVKLLKFAVT